jgi:hypothetical protein
MVSTYLSSKKVLDSLIANTKFVNLATTIVNSDKGTPTYLETYNALLALLKSLGITERVNIIKSDGGYWFDNRRTPDDTTLNGNLNTRPEIFSALNYVFGNPICNKKLYPLDLQSSVCSGYGFASRRSSNNLVTSQYVAMTYKPTPSPLSTDVFTLRVYQDVKF